MQKHKHNWHSRTKHDKNGWYIKGYVCACGAKQYVDLLKGIPGEDKESKELESKM